MRPIILVLCTDGSMDIAATAMLGKNATAMLLKVDAYFVSAMLGTAGLAYALPHGNRRMFLWGVTAMETVVIIRNHSVGIRMAF